MTEQQTEKILLERLVVLEDGLYIFPDRGKASAKPLGIPLQIIHREGSLVEAGVRKDFGEGTFIEGIRAKLSLPNIASEYKEAKLIELKQMSFD